MKKSDKRQFDIEINNQTRLARVFEIVPGLTAWLFLLSPIVLSFTRPLWLAYLIIGYDLLWLVKSFGLSYRLLKGYKTLRQSQSINWASRINDLNNIQIALKRLQKRLERPKRTAKNSQMLINYYNLLQSFSHSNDVLQPATVYNAVIIATYNEDLDTLEPTVRSLLTSDYPLEHMFLFIAYEQRGGMETKKNATYLINKYGSSFGYATAVEHPVNIPGETIGKGGNITFCAKELTVYVKKRGIEAERIIVTTLDSDNRPAQNYFSYLTYIYCTTQNRTRKSYQPIPMFYNNIWDVPAPMRVIATGNTFWQLMEMMRPFRLRNFSAHAQSLKTLLDTNYWSVKTVVEDGHQYWRTYFTYNGDHEAIPLYTAVYQDAVLARGYIRTFRAQFIQLRRWAWGASDVSYFVTHAYKNKNISFSNRLLQFSRLFEGHFSWATAPMILAFGAWIPLLVNTNFNDFVLAHQLPVIASRIQTLTTLGVIITVLISMISLPPRPSYYKRRRSIMMIGQWILLPITTIFFGSFAALSAQTRLMFKQYLEEFDVTEKVVKKWK
jgi:hypothetical protein